MKDELYSEFYDNPYNSGVKVKQESEAAKRHREEKYFNPSDDDFEGDHNEDKDRRNLKFKMPGHHGCRGAKKVYKYSTDQKMCQSFLRFQRYNKDDPNSPFQLQAFNFLHTHDLDITKAFPS